MIEYHTPKRVSKRQETGKRGNNIYLRAGKRSALYPPHMAPSASHLALGDSRIICFDQNPYKPLDFESRCVFSNGSFKNFRVLPASKKNSNGSFRWQWGPDMAIYNQDAKNE